MAIQKPTNLTNKKTLSNNIDPELSVRCEAPDSVGIVEPLEFHFADPPDYFKLQSGEKLGPITIFYETYGNLNASHSNAVMIFHATTANHHAAGFHHRNDKHPGWWDAMIGPGKAFDTDKYFVICSNFIGGCHGSTGPASINPVTGKQYGLSFPVLTIGDMVQAQYQLIKYLKINQLYCAAGGSMGGMQALEWAVRFPNMVKSAIVLASTATISAQGIAFHAIGRNAITSDPSWCDGYYYGKTPPRKGLATARKVGHLTYLSDKSLGARFGRELQEHNTFEYNFNDKFKVESYLEHKGKTFAKTFDANAYLYITKAMDYYDLTVKPGGLINVFRHVEAKFLLASFTSDWLYPPSQSKAIVSALMQAGKDVSYVQIDSPHGHDSFLIETERQTRIIQSFLKSVDKS